eukprot:CAMPEP_0115439976 /NCGR_PEP_ID=MMETSP0271-20121206/36054_1 /TAXON_ID=71861 /ORGANISM="Scrippsiella trochoidea, Strain CCMP3099" /LENGTH=53 /DNA_ID=CAMNT_0002865685 /DNA_START=108 /DNA_END=269 /DNA_ORIENTATION=-
MITTIEVPLSSNLSVDVALMPTNAMPGLRMRAATMAALGKIFFVVFAATILGE